MVAQQCIYGNPTSQWERANFDPLQNCKPKTITLISDMMSSGKLVLVEVYEIRPK